MKKKFKKIISIVMIAAVIASVCVVGTVSSSASGTGVGLAEWALNAYYSNWSYVYGGCTPGSVDCSGLIYSYAGGYRVGDAQTFNSDYRYSLSGSIPNIHGLGLYKPGHVGVYVGNGMAVDARGSEYGVCYESVWSHGWTQYFKVPGVSYPDTGWVEFDGDDYYYEDGEYLADTTRTINGVTYTFASSGKATSSSSGNSNPSTETSSSSDDSNDTGSGSLKIGSTGEEVEKLQKRLTELGYYNGEIDGNYGVDTESAFKLFQLAAGLYVDGIAGSDADLLYADDAPAYKAEAEDTEKVANDKEDLAETGAEAEDEAEEAAPTAISYSESDYSDEVLKIQERLISLGYMEGTADGEFGSMTTNAVMGFQTTNSLEATGIVEQTTYDALFSDSAIAAKKEEVKPTENEAKVTDEKAPAAAGISEGITNNTGNQTASVPNTEVEKKTSELSSKGVAAVSDNKLFKRGANATNFEFLIWLAIMIVVMTITFAVVYAVEKKKQRANRGRRYQ